MNCSKSLSSALLLFKHSGRAFLRGTPHYAEICHKKWHCVTLPLFLPQQPYVTFLTYGISCHRITTHASHPYQLSQQHLLQLCGFPERAQPTTSRGKGNFQKGEPG